MWLSDWWNAMDDQIRREDIRRFIEQYTNDHGYPPSRREIADRLKMSLTTTQADIVTMIEDGELSAVPGVARSLRVLPRES